uniref:ParB N-terminal domain-containing protein n=1 Tax=Prevotella sp. TaxID=59823 RepID=UPI003FEF6DB1
MVAHKKYNRSVLGRGLNDIEGGKGLDALIDTNGVRTQGTSTINEIPLDQIEPNPNQPRHDFDADALQELANSIREIGIIQPITLRQTAANRFQIIAGARRGRASQMAGLA